MSKHRKSSVMSVVWALRVRLDAGLQTLRARDPWVLVGALGAAVNAGAVLAVAVAGSLGVLFHPGMVGVCAVSALSLSAVSVSLLGRWGRSLPDDDPYECTAEVPRPAAARTEFTAERDDLPREALVVDLGTGHVDLCTLLGWEADYDVDGFLSGQRPFLEYAEMHRFGQRVQWGPRKRMEPLWAWLPGFPEAADLAHLFGIPADTVLMDHFEADMDFIRAKVGG